MIAILPLKSGAKYDSPDAENPEYQPACARSSQAPVRARSGIALRPERNDRLQRVSGIQAVRLPSEERLYHRGRIRRFERGPASDLAVDRSRTGQDRRPARGPRELQ